MKIIEPKYEILSIPYNALENIERAARTCYKSEEKIESGSAERLVKKLIRDHHYAMLEFGGVIWVRFTSNRGFSHELVRHRLSSFAQESTRYCNYSQSKFDRELSFIDPKTIVSGSMAAEALSTWIYGCDAVFRFTEEWYLKMVDSGVPPQLAREILPIGVKTEINIQANIVEWRHIFSQRTAPGAHPRMKELMRPLLKELIEKIPVVFDDLSSERVR